MFELYRETTTSIYTLFYGSRYATPIWVQSLVDLVFFVSFVLSIVAAIYFLYRYYEKLRYEYGPELKSKAKILDKEYSTSTYTHMQSTGYNVQVPVTTTTEYYYVTMELLDVSDKNRNLCEDCESLYNKVKVGDTVSVSYKKKFDRWKNKEFVKYCLISWE